MAEFLRDPDKGLLFEYKNILLGGNQKLPIETYTKNKESDHEVALKVFRFAVEVFLRWTPEMTKELMSESIMQKMHLTNIYSKIIVPPELNRDSDYWYIAYLLYPHIYHYSEEECVCKVYKGVLQDMADGGKYRFPKNFFNGTKGRDRACICLNYYINNYESFHDVNEMYAFFASPAGIRTLNQHGLKHIADSIFESPVQFLHMSLPDDMKDEFLYHYYTFQWMYKSAQKAAAELNFTNRILGK